MDLDENAEPRFRQVVSFPSEGTNRDHGGFGAAFTIANPGSGEYRYFFARSDSSTAYLYEVEPKP